MAAEEAAAEAVVWRAVGEACHPMREEQVQPMGRRRRRRRPRQPRTSWQLRPEIYAFSLSLPKVRLRSFLLRPFASDDMRAMNESAKYRLGVKINLQSLQGQRRLLAHQVKSQI